MSVVDSKDSSCPLTSNMTSVTNLHLNSTSTPKSNSFPNPFNQPIDSEDLKYALKDPFFIYKKQEQYLSHPQIPPVEQSKIRQLFRSFFNKHSLFLSQIESFDHFIKVMVPSIIKDIGKVEVKFREPLNDKHVVEFTNVVIGKPTIREPDGTVRYVTPQECVARRTTYYANVMVDVYHEVYEQKLTSECEELKEGVKEEIKTVRDTIDTGMGIRNVKSDLEVEKNEIELIQPPSPSPSLPLPDIIHSIFQSKLSKSEQEMKTEYDQRFYKEEKVTLNPETKNTSNNTSTTSSTSIPTTTPSTTIPTTNPTPNINPNFAPNSTLDESMYTYVLKNRNVYAEHTLFRMPVMIGSCCCHTNTYTHSDVCPYVSGGYFVVSGNERVILPQEKLRNNHFVITVDKSGKNIYNGEFRSWNENKIRTTSTFYMGLSCTRGSTQPMIMLDIPFIKNSISLSHLFRLIGIHNPQEMRRYILAHEDYINDHPYDNYILSVLHDEQIYYSVDELKLKIIGDESETNRTKNIRNFDNTFNNEFFPNMGLEREESTQKKKALFLGYLIMRMLKVYNGDEMPDDRDDYTNKRLEPVHMLCGLLFRQLFRNFLKTLAGQIHKALGDKKYVYVADLIKNSQKITGGFEYALNTGNWGTSRASSTQVGVAQNLTRMTPISTICHLRRTNTPINKEGKASKPRQLDLSAWGISCSTESPEGPACGLVKNMAMTTYIRIGYPSLPILDLLRHYFTFLLQSTPENIQTGIWIFMNGGLISTVPSQEASAFVQKIRNWKRNGEIPFDISIIYYEQKREIHIVTDSGCCLRPIFVLENMYKFQQIFNTYQNNLYMLWDKMVSNGVIEYVDKEEESTLRVATMWSDLKVPRKADEIPFTHIEIHPIVILGISASFVPLSNHNPAPRNTYGSSMLKQGVGRVGLNADKRFDTSGIHELFYPQSSLVSSFTEVLTRLNEMAYGDNVMVAVLCRKYNQEDSVIFNQASIDKGLFRSLYFRTHRETARSSGSDQEVFQHIDEKEVVGMKKANYSKLTEDGLPDLGQVIEQDDVIIGKVNQPKDASKAQDYDNLVKDRSNIYKYKEKTVVDKLIKTSTKDGYEYVNVRTRSLRIPVVGDKFSSRHGQKGVCSLILPPEDMPFTANGISPDIIINPHAIPSRMTIAQLLETLLGKAALIKGKFGNGTAFEHLEEFTREEEEWIKEQSKGGDSCDGDDFGDDGVDDEEEIDNEEINNEYNTTRRKKQKVNSNKEVEEEEIGNEEINNEYNTTRRKKQKVNSNEPSLKNLKNMSFVQKIGNILHAGGYNRNGNERMYDGETGELIEAQIFFGPCYYMRLKHMVDDKCHSRCTGPRQILTRQPVEGRSREGGLRFGEMERDALLSYGAAAVLKDRLLDVSDRYTAPVCSKCGLFAHGIPQKPNYSSTIIRTEAKAYCKRCKTGDYVKPTVMPYAFKVLQQYLEASNISMKMNLTEDK